MSFVTHNLSPKGKPQYKAFTYTSKNEFYVIDITKSKQEQQVQSEDVGISTTELDSEDERGPDNSL